MNLHLTNHVVDRYLERKLRVENKIGSKTFERSIRRRDANWQDSKRELRTLVKDTHEIKYHMNNHRFLDYYYEMYGYDSVCQFLLNDEKKIVFIVKDSVVITCITLDQYMNRIKRR